MQWKRGINSVIFAKDDAEDKDDAEAHVHLAIDDGEETDTDILAVLMDGDCSGHETRGPATHAKNPDGGDALLDCASETLSLLQPQNTGWVEVADAPLFLPEGPVACTTSSDDNGCIYCE